MNEHSFIADVATPTLTGAQPDAPPKAVAILDAALDLFGERGYGETAVPAVADRARVAVGTIYRYFPGKSGVVNAVYRRWKAMFAESLTGGVDLDGDPKSTFDRIWDNLATFATDHPDAFAFLETHHHAAYLDAASVAAGAEVDAAMASLVRRWQRAGAIRSGDAGVLVAQAFGGFVGVVRHRRAAGRPITRSIADQTRHAAWNAIAARPEGAS